MSKKISFIDNSFDLDGTIAQWEWNFGDGNTSIEQFPVHEYAEVGSYNVTLTVTDNDGLTDSVTRVVQATEQSLNLPTADFAIDTELFDFAFGTIVDTFDRVAYSLFGGGIGSGPGGISSVFLLFNPTGDILYSAEGIEINVLNASEPWQLDSIDRVNQSININDVSGFSDNSNENQILSFNDDGSKLFVLVTHNTHRFHQFNLQTLYDVTPNTSMSYSGVVNNIDSIIVSSNSNITTNNIDNIQIFNFEFVDNGSKLLLIYKQNDFFAHVFNLDNPWDISSITHNSVAFLSDLIISNDDDISTVSDLSNGLGGTLLLDESHLLFMTQDTFFEFSFQSDYDLSSLSYIQKIDISPSYEIPDISPSIVPITFFIDKEKKYIMLLYSRDGEAIINRYEILYNLPRSLEVNFIDNSTTPNQAIINWSWNFGDNNNSTEQNPTHTYISHGDYNVNLTVIDDQSFLDSLTQTVSLNLIEHQPPTVDFSYSIIESSVLSINNLLNPTESNVEVDNLVFGVSVFDGLLFNNDGEKVYVADTSNRRFGQYFLFDAWNITTFIISEDSPHTVFSVVDIDGQPSFSNFNVNPLDLALNNDGSKWYVLYIEANNLNAALPVGWILEYNLSDNWDIESAAYSGISINLSEIIGSSVFEFNSLHFRPDGKKLYVLGTENISLEKNVISNFIYELDLSSAWDLSTVEYNSIKINIDQDLITGNIANDMYFNDDGNIIYILDGNNIIEFNLLESWNILSIGQEKVFDSQDLLVFENGTLITSFFFRPGLNQMYVSMNTGHINSFDLDTNSIISKGLDLVDTSTTTNPSDMIVQWIWEFGDGYVYNIQNVKHNYRSVITNSGSSVDVVVNIVDSNGIRNSTTKTINF